MTTVSTNRQCGQCLVHTTVFVKTLCDVCGKDSEDQAPKGWYSWAPPNGVVWQRGEGDHVITTALDSPTSSSGDNLCSKECLKERIEQMTDGWYERLGLI